MGRGLSKRPLWLFLLAGVVVCLFAAAPSSRAQSLAEALDTPELTWTTGGDVPWFAQTTNTHDGVDAVRSGVLGSNQMSWIETTVIGPGTVSFWMKQATLFPVSFLSTFTINGHPPFGSLITAYPDNQWNKQTNDLYEGQNVLRWLASDYWGSATVGFLVLDEIAVGPARPLTVTYQPYDRAVYSGEWTSFVVAAQGTPPYRFQWQKDGTNIAGATNDALYFERVTTNNAGVYSVIVSNAHEMTLSSNAVLTVLPPAAPVFNFEPASMTGYSGQNLMFSGSVSGSPPFTFIWKKDRTSVLVQQFEWSFAPSSSSLTLTNISLADQGIYTLFVSNEVGSIESSNAVLTVIPSIAPAITRHPRSLEVAAGVSTWLSVLANGKPEPNYKWKKVGEPPPPDDPMPPLPPTPPIHVSDSSVKRFFNATTNDAGVYFVTVSNYAGGVASRQALLTVLPPMESVGSWWQGAEDIYVTNGLAFLAQGTAGISILDVSNLSAPVMLGGYNTSGTALSVCMRDGLAFVADGNSGLHILAITNPANPNRLGGYDTSGYASDVVVRSNLAYVADGAAGLLILDVSNPATPGVVGSFKTNFRPSHIDLSGGYAVLTSPYSDVLPGTNVAGLFVVDITTPQQPFEVGRIGTGIGKLHVQNKLVFGVNDNSLRVISLTNPAQPTLIGTLNTCFTNAITFPPLIIGISAKDVRVANHLAYVTGHSENESRLYVVDVRDPSEPIPVGYYTIPGQRTALWVEGNLVYLVGSESPMDIVQTPFNTHHTVPPTLTISGQPNFKLNIHGRRGLHYNLEYTYDLTGSAWQTLQMLLLTNEQADIELPSSQGVMFFRAEQLD